MCSNPLLSHPASINSTLPKGCVLPYVSLVPTTTAATATPNVLTRGGNHVDHSARYLTASLWRPHVLPTRDLRLTVSSGRSLVPKVTPHPAALPSPRSSQQARGTEHSPRNLTARQSRQWQTSPSAHVPLPAFGNTAPQVLTGLLAAQLGTTVNASPTAR